MRMRFGPLGLSLYFGGIVLLMVLLSVVCLWGVRHAKTPATQAMQSRS